MGGAVGAILVFLVVGLPVMNGVAWLRGKLVRLMLGTPPQPAATTARRRPVTTSD